MQHTRARIASSPPSMRPCSRDFARCIVMVRDRARNAIDAFDRASSAEINREKSRRRARIPRAEMHLGAREQRDVHIASSWFARHVPRRTFLPRSTRHVRSRARSRR